MDVFLLIFEQQKRKCKQLQVHEHFLVNSYVFIKRKVFNIHKIEQNFSTDRPTQLLDLVFV